MIDVKYLRQAIIWIIDSVVYWRIYESRVVNELRVVLQSLSNLTKQWCQDAQGDFELLACNPTVFNLL